MTIKHLDALRTECLSAPIATLVFIVCLETFITVGTGEGLMEVHKVGAVGHSLVVTRAHDGAENGILRGKSDSTYVSYMRSARVCGLQCERRWTLRWRFCVLLYL